MGGVGGWRRNELAVDFLFTKIDFCLVFTQGKILVLLNLNYLCVKRVKMKSEIILLEKWNLD